MLPLQDSFFIPHIVYPQWVYLEWKTLKCTLLYTKEPIHDGKIIPFWLRGILQNAIAWRLPCAIHFSFGCKLLQGRRFSTTCHVSAWLLISAQQISVVSYLTWSAALAAGIPVARNGPGKERSGIQVRMTIARSQLKYSEIKVSSHDAANYFRMHENEHT